MSRSSMSILRAVVVGSAICPWRNIYPISARWILIPTTILLCIFIFLIGDSILNMRSGIGYSSRHDSTKHSRKDVECSGENMTTIVLYYNDMRRCCLNARPSTCGWDIDDASHIKAHCTCLDCLIVYKIVCEEHCVLLLYLSCKQIHVHVVQ
jgi:hypothetical protein